MQPSRYKADILYHTVTGMIYLIDMPEVYSIRFWECGGIEHYPNQQVASDIVGDLA